MTLRRHVLIVAGLGLALAAAGCTSEGTTPAAANSPSPTTAAAVAAQDGPSASTVDAICALNSKIDDDTNGTIMDHADEVGQIASMAPNAGDTSVRLAAAMLGDRYELASKGSDPSLALDAMSAHLKLTAACLNAGWQE